MADDGRLQYQLGIDTTQMLVDASKAGDVFTDLTQRAKEGGDAIDEAYKKASAEIKTAYEALDIVGDETRKNIAELTKEMDLYKKSASDAFMRGDDATYRQLTEQTKEIESQIKERKNMLSEIESTVNALSEEEKQLNKNYESAKKTTQSHNTMRTEIRNLREGLIEMEMSGKRNTKEYEEMRVKLGKLTDAYSDASTQARIFAHDNQSLQGVISGLSGLAGAFSVAQGTIGMFAGESENLTKVLTKVQSIMAVTNGLQTVANTLNKDSAFRLTTLAKLQSLWSNSIKATGTQLIKFGASAKVARASAIALNSALTLGIGVAIAGAVALFTRYMNKVNEAKEVQKKFNDEAIKAGSEPVASIQRMANEWNRLDLQGKEKFVRDNAKAFHDLGVEVNNVADAENLLVKNKEAFILAQMAKAKSIAGAKLAEEKATEYVQKSMELSDITKNATVTAETRNAWLSAYNKALVDSEDEQIQSSREYARKYYKNLLDTYQEGEVYLRNDAKNRKDELERELSALNGDIAKFYEASEKDAEEASKILEEAGIKPNSIAEGTVEWYQNKIKDLQESLNKLSDETGAEGAKIQKEILEYQEKIDKITAKGYGQDKNNAVTKTEDPILTAIKEKKQAYEEASTLMNSTNEETVKYGQQLYDALKVEGEDYLSYLINLRDQSTDLTSEQLNALNIAIANASQKQEQKEKETMERLQKDYETYIEAKTALDNEYQQKLAKYEANNQTEKAKLLTDDYNKQNKELDERFGKNLLKDIEPINRAMEKASKQTKDNLKQSLSVLTKLTRYKKSGDTKDLEGSGITKEQADKIDLEQLELVYQQLIELQDEYDKKTNYPFHNLIEGFKSLKQAEKDYKAGNKDLGDEEKVRGQKLLKEAVSNSATAFSELGQVMSDLGDLTGSAKLKNLGDAFSDVANVISGIVSGFASGSVWGAVIGGVSSLVQVAVKGAQKIKLANEEATSSYYAFADAVRKKNLELKEEDYTSIFGTDNVNKAKDALAQYRQAYSDFNEYVNKSSGQTRKSVQDDIEGVFINGKNSGKLRGWQEETKSLEDLIKSREKYNEQLTDLQAISFKTESASWWARTFRGKTNEYSTLVDYKLDNGEGVFDEDGAFNVENAKLFLDTAKNISSEQRSMIQEAIDYNEAMKQAKETLDGIAGDIVGNMASKMGNAIQDAVLSGADSFSVFESAGADAIKNLGDMLIQEMLVTNWLNKYQDDISDAMGEGDWNRINEIMAQIGSEASTVYENTTESLKAFYESAEQAGVNLDSLYQSASRTASASGIAQASQDSIDELNGRMTAVQGHTFQIAQNSQLLAQRQADILRVLQGISNDTARLEAIENNLASVNTAVSQMATKGVKAL